MPHFGQYGFAGGFGEFTPLYPAGPVGPAIPCGPVYPAFQLLQLPADRTWERRPATLTEGTPLAQALQEANGFLATPTRVLDGFDQPVDVGPQPDLKARAAELETALRYGWTVGNLPIPPAMPVFSTMLVHLATPGVAEAPDALFLGVETFHDLAWRVRQLRTLRGFLVHRTLRHTGRASDRAYLLDAERAPACPEGRRDGFRTELRLTQQAQQEIDAGKADLARHVEVLDQYLRDRGIQTPSRWLGTTGLLVGAAAVAGAVYWALRKRGYTRRRAVGTLVADLPVERLVG